MLKILSGMVLTVEDAKSLLQRDLVTELEKLKANIIANCQERQFPYFSQSKLYEDLIVLKAVRR